MNTHTRTVYRVEVLTGPFKGAGPYRGAPDWLEGDERLYDLHAEAIGRVTSWDEEHPTPQDEPRLYTIVPDEVCGFDSIEQARRWFRHGALEALLGIRHYYGLIAYEVPAEDVRDGDFQVVFRPARALDRKRISLPA